MGITNGVIVKWFKRKRKEKGICKDCKSWKSYTPIWGNCTKRGTDKTIRYDKSCNGFEKKEKEA